MISEPVTVEPLLVDSLYSRHNTKDLPIKNTFQGTKYTLCNTFFEPLNSGNLSINCFWVPPIIYKIDCLGGQKIIPRLM